LLLSLVEPPVHRKPIQSVAASGSLRIQTKRVFACTRGAPSSCGALEVDGVGDDAAAGGGEAVAEAAVAATGAPFAAVAWRCPVSLGCSAAHERPSKKRAEAARLT
jgi:hypothetical protein